MLTQLQLCLRRFICLCILTIVHYKGFSKFINSISLEELNAEEKLTAILRVTTTLIK